MLVSRSRRRATAVLGLAAAALLALPTAATAADLAACDDLLVTITPAGTSGDVYAAAVTAQALVADQPGWDSVTWQVSDDTDLREVLVLGADGATRSSGAARTGNADAVLALGFCGTRSVGSPEPTGETEEDADATSKEPGTIDSQPETDVEAAPGTPTPDDLSDPSDDDGSRGAQGGDADQASAAEAVEADDERDETSTEADGEGETTDNDDRDVAAILPVGPTAGPYYDAARVAATLATAPAPTSELVPPGVTLLAASPGVAAAASAPAATTDGTDLGGVVLGLLAGAAVGVAMLMTRERMTTEVRA